MFAKKTEKLMASPNDLNQLSESLALLTQLQQDAPAIESQFQPIHEQYQILEKYEVQIREEEKRQLESLSGAWVAMQQTMVEAEKMLQDSKSKFKSDLLSSVDDFSKGMSSVREEFTSKGPFAANFGVEKALKAIGEYKQMMINAAEQEANLQKGLRVFKLEQPPSKEIGQINSELESLQQIWQLTSDWVTVWEDWRTKPFLTLDASEMEESVQKFLKKLQKMGKEMKEWGKYSVPLRKNNANDDADVYVNLREKISQTRRTIPVLTDLKNPAMRDRHWNQIMEETGKTFDPNSPQFSLEKIFEIGLDQ
ncbi:Dynein heavy chain 2, axonemal [Rhizoclosmatium hyalinum]|nr:Dynein heavy chain 2, axonemal [Rhizoclosmatium hyalinum]